MKKNMGGTDRTFRFLVAVIIAGLWLMGAISGTVAIVLGVVAVVFFLTSLAGSCPAYSAFGWSTRKTVPGQGV